MDAQALAAVVEIMSGSDDPYPHYAVLRELAPVFKLSPKRVVISTFDLCQQVLKDPRFRSRDLSTADIDWPGWQEHSSVRNAYRTMLFANPPEHSSMRRPYARLTAPAALSQFQDLLVCEATAHLDRFAEHADARPDFIAEFARRFPTAVALRLLGLSTDDLDWWIDRLEAYTHSIEHLPPGHNLENADEATDELLDRIAAELGHAEPNTPFVLTAAAETTTNLLASGLFLMLSGVEYGPGFIAEVLRFEAPIQLTTRICAEPVELGGVSIAEGTVVIVLFGSANRDETRFPDAAVFDANRPPNPGLTFSAGPHFCLGAGLAQREAEVVFPMLRQRFPQLQLAEQPRWQQHMLRRGLIDLRVRL